MAKFVVQRGCFHEGRRYYPEEVIEVNGSSVKNLPRHIVPKAEFVRRKTPIMPQPVVQVPPIPVLNMTRDPEEIERVRAYGREPETDDADAGSDE